MKVEFIVELLDKIDPIHQDGDHVIEFEMDFRPMVGDWVPLLEIIKTADLQNKIPVYVLEYIESVDLFEIYSCSVNFRKIGESISLLDGFKSVKIESILTVNLIEVEFGISDDDLDRIARSN